MSAFTHQTVVTLVVDHSHPIENLAEKVAGRASSMDGVMNVEVSGGESISVDLTTQPPGEPSPGLLMAMAIRFDPSLGEAEFAANYDRLMGAGSCNARIQRIVSMMRALFMEATGQGGYTPDQESYYRELSRTGLNTPALLAAKAAGQTPIPQIL